MKRNIEFPIKEGGSLEAVAIALDHCEEYIGAARSHLIEAGVEGSRYVFDGCQTTGLVMRGLNEGLVLLFVA